jgi:hypothetical protein
MGIAEFQADCRRSEQLRLQAMGPQNVPDNSGIPGRCTIPVPPLPQSVVRQITIDHYRRLRASAIANGITPAPYISALMDLGTGGV